MEFKSINPYNGEVISTFTSLNKNELDIKLDLALKTFKTWREVSLMDRSKLLGRAGEVLLENMDEFARMITMEMGKPIQEAIAEIKKCAWVCAYYAQNATEFLADEIIESDAGKSFVRHEPIGGVLAIMPWNFPFWQVFRFAAPNLIAGNVGLLKHASNVFGCAQLIEKVFLMAGFPKGVFQNLMLDHAHIAHIISHTAVQGVTLTGSEAAGSSVAAIAGKYIKKTVLELGGSNAFIVWDDADIDEAVEKAVTARMLNCGQSCIAAKRFILLEGIYDEFVDKFKERVSQLKSGDPLLRETEIGPLARKDLADELHRQMNDAIAKGAKLLLGGNQKDAFHEPTVLGDVLPDMAVFKEETFGPLATMMKVKTIDEAFELANQSRFGLGVTVCTKNIQKALEMTAKVGDGAYFINELVKSDPRLPFGGTKYSGYGRELSKDGIMEFVNRKTVYVK